MPELEYRLENMQTPDHRMMSVCIQALQDAIKYYEFLSQSETVDIDDYQECIFMYERQLCQLVKLYKKAEAEGNVNIPLEELLSPPYDELKS